MKSNGEREKMNKIKHSKYLFLLQNSEKYTIRIKKLKIAKNKVVPAITFSLCLLLVGNFLKLYPHNKKIKIENINKNIKCFIYLYFLKKFVLWIYSL